VVKAIVTVEEECGRQQNLSDVIEIPEKQDAEIDIVMKPNTSVV